MAIDIQSLFNPGSLQQMAGIEDDRKKKAQLTGTMNLGGQTGTFTGTFDPQAFQQMQNNMSAPVGYQPPPNYGMQAPPEQQPVPVIQPPAPTPPAGTSPISGEFSAPPAPPAPLPPANQPYVAPPAPVAPPNYYGDLTPGEALGGEFTVQPPARDPRFAGMPDDMYNAMMEFNQTVGPGGFMTMDVKPWDEWMFNQRQQQPPNYYGDLTPGQALGGEFTMGSMEMTPGPIAPGGMGFGLS